MKVRLLVITLLQVDIVRETGIDKANRHLFCKFNISLFYNTLLHRTHQYMPQGFEPPGSKTLTFCIRVTLLLTVAYH
jgi:hypothetical protein